MSKKIAELLSDLDGTAFEKLSSKNPGDWWRNGTKRNLALMEGYPDFLTGVLSVEGVEMGGAATVRKPWLRRKTTLQSMRQHALEQFFLDPERIAFGSSEKGKAQAVAGRSRDFAVGMIEDQPQKHVAELVNYSVRIRSQDGDEPHHNPILVGVVAHPSSQDRIESLRLDLEHTTHERVTVRPETGTNTGLVIYAEPLTIHVTQLDPYSQTGGQEFGEKLIDLAV